LTTETVYEGKLVLASASPRRRALLAELHIPFVVYPTAIDEELLEEQFIGPTSELATYLARHKAEALLSDDRFSDSIILAADTTVILDGAILGKPRDAADARRMLTSLRARTHTVVTGIAVIDRQRGIEVRACSTPVTMRPYSDAEIDAYIATGDPFDKAGSYAIQHPSFQPVAQISGCATNVIGLPLCVTIPLLRTAGLSITRGPQHIGCEWDARCAVSQ
jgi:septum formation protein